jgi:hypothetical protein
MTRFLIVHTVLNSVIFKESNYVPRIGDEVALFNVRPFPVVTKVIAWPEQAILGELTKLVERADDIEVLVFVE